MVAANREYKDRLFSFLFGSEEHRDWTLSLYNAVNRSAYEDADAIRITTIREVLYLGMHNDVSFLISPGEMSLYEQQSTYNPNMPLRLLQYLGSLYEKHVKEGRYDKYGDSVVPLPAPRLVVFYNGADDAPDERTLLLSEAFPPGMEGDVEVRVRMLNINKGRNGELMGACEPLAEYAWIVDRIRANRAALGTEGAVDEAILSMPEHFVTRQTLLAHKAEVKDMLLTEYNEAEALELARENAQRKGYDQGISQGIVTTCLALGAPFAQASSMVASALGLDAKHADEETRKYWS